MEDKMYRDATRLAKRMKKLTDDATKAGLQFVVIDDSVCIGDANIPDTWESLISKHGTDDFISCKTYIAGIGA